MAFGLTPQGFLVKQQQDIIAEIQAALQAAFGQNINLLPEAVFGQLVGIFSEREALIWQLAEAVYASQYPNGAEGTSVDNILALNGLKRLPARATVTAPNENGQIGLEFFGTPATVIPAGSIISVMGSPQIQFTVDTPVTIQNAVNAIQNFTFSSVPTQGAFSVSIKDPAGNTLTTASVPYTALANQTQLNFSAVPVTGNFSLTLTQAGVAHNTGLIPFTANAAAVQGVINAVSGYGGVTVSGSYAAGFVISWNAIANPLVNVLSNTLGVTITEIDSLQADVNNLHDVTAGNYPYTDVTVTGSFTTAFIVSFGAMSPVGSNPSSGAQAQNLFVQVTNTLQTGSTLVNINIFTTQAGSVPAGIGSATCTQTGPISVPANTLTVIGSPISGWSSVTNPLDCIVGANIEDDTQALARRIKLLGSTSISTLQSIVDKVIAVSAVEQVIGFENITDSVDGFGRPAHSFEIVVLGGADQDIANAIYSDKPAGIRSFGSTSVTVFDSAGFSHTIQFSRPTIVPIYVKITLVTNSQFPVNGAQLIQNDIVTIGNAVPIGGLIVGFGTNGLIGAFNNVPGIISYTLFFGTSPNPVTNTNVQLLAEQLGQFESFNVVIQVT